MRRTPLVLFVYNRPRHTERALKAISRLERLAECDLIVHCDGAIDPERADRVNETRHVVSQFAPALNARVIERPENVGLAAAIAGTVTKIVQDFGRIIVLEDDLVPSPDFVEFMLAALDRYEHVDDVAQISGCVMSEGVQVDADAFFLPGSSTWGWATWQRAWRLFRWQDEIDVSDAASHIARLSLGPEISAYCLRMLHDRIEGKNNSWGILWLYAVAQAQKLVLYPRKSLIWNGGFDGSGVHCHGAAAFTPDPPRRFLQSRLQHPVQWPSRCEIHREDEAAMLEVAAAFINGTATEAPLAPEHDPLLRRQRMS
jgi:hypothetical protein